MLTRVTITGADDDVDPEDLHKLSREFPYVEWGILHSVKRAGKPRYPSAKWMGDLVCSLTGRPPLQLSAHLCGDYARAVLDGDDACLDTLVFQRHQVNGFKLPAPAFVEKAHRVPTEFVLQVRSETELQPTADVARCLGADRASLLFDASGGRGVEATRWPERPRGVAMGYAGGIRPSTVESVLEAIGPVAEDFWIDMESGVRTGDKFDLVLVREVLEQAAPWVRRSN